MSDLITITSKALPAATEVVGFRGHEALSQPFELEIFFTLTGDLSAELELGSAVGAKATLVLDRAFDGMPPFVFSGILAVVELLHEVSGQALFRAVMVPRLWLLGLSKHSRLFTKMSLPEILRAVLAQNGLSGDAVELRLGAYPVEEHICQYRESDLDFISRWMEREGIYYFFEHSEEGDKLVLCDNPVYEKDDLGRPVRYHPQLGQDRSAGASFRSFTARHAKLPAKVHLTDYDYAKPKLELSGSALVAPTGTGEVSLYGERFWTPDGGHRLAKLRAEELLTRQVLFLAKGTRTHLRTGHTFDLEEHGRGSLNAKYLTIEAKHHGNQSAGHAAFKELLGLEHDDVYFVEVTAIPAKTQFRPESRTAWPRIYGYENGTVDGPATSEYAQIDEMGRYNVRFKFDESDLGGGKASTWVRMMQPHGGGIEGFHFPLRKDTEVVFSFLGGDPDRPVISGVVNNTLTPSPINSGNHTRNVLQTGGRNRLELEDLAGQQRITLSTPYSNTFIRMGCPNDAHEFIMYTDDNTKLEAGKDFDLLVGQVGGGSWVSTVQKDMTTTVQTGDVTMTVVAGQETTTVEKLVGEHYHASQETYVQDDRKLQTIAGGYFAGVANGFAVNAVNGAQFIVNNGAGIPSGTSTTGFLADVYSGEVKAWARAGELKLLASGDVTLKSTGANVEIEGTDVKVTSRGKHDWLTMGDLSHVTIGTGTTLTMAATKNYKLALEENITVGASKNFKFAADLNVTVGASLDVFVGLKASFEAALKLDASMGASLHLCSALDLYTSPVEVRAATLAAKQHGAFCQMAGLTLFA